MTLHFDETEFADRKARLMASMNASNIDAMLMFRQESMYWLTGYDTFGYVFFQSLVMTADGRIVLMTRAPDLRQAQNTSNIADIRIWVDRDGASPADDLRAILDELGLAGARLGVEYEAYGLTGRNAMRLNAALDGFATLIDESEMISLLRLVKSPAEIAYTRRAGELADDALDAAHELICGGANEGDILAAMHSAIYRGGGDDPGNEFIIGSGPDALLCRYKSGRRCLDAEDQITLEWAGVYRHYHAAMMRTIPVGRALPEHVAMHAACLEALEACHAAYLPGNLVGDVFDAYAKVMDARGYSHARMNATGYSMGTTFAPNWMDWPMFYHGNPVVLEEGMCFFMHMILMDSDTGTAMNLGESFVLEGGKGTRLSRSSRDLAVG
ncbi:Xaa-Pro peptidase family protein [Alphaproteobacteria bacterium]|nr:Xaa-Pro peptidase family protein [Alphaproteobacteria bacterium]